MTNSKKSTNDSSKNNELYAIAETSGQQFWFEVNRYYDIDRLNAKEKDKIVLEKVLLLKDKNSITIGKPYVKDAKIELEVVSHKRDKKIIVYKMRPKKKTRRKMGHRQELTRVMVKSISKGNGSPKTPSKKETVKKEAKPKSEKSTN
nr:50S ribosomal protein L21 [Prochlorococcus marinus]